MKSLISTSDLPLARGAPRETELSALAEQARLVLEIVPGERRRLPAFGCRLHEISLESPASREIAAALVEEALERWAPGLGVERAEVLVPEGGRIHLRLWSAGQWHALTITHRFAAQAESGGEERTCS